MIYLGRVLFVRMDQRLTPQAFERFLNELGRSIDLRTRGTLIGTIYDVPDIAQVDALRRKRVAEVLDARKELLASTTVGIALASPSKVVRGVFEAIHWMAPPPYAHTAVNTVREGLTFLSQFLTEVDAEAYDFEYQRRLARHGVFASSLRPPPSVSPASAGFPQTGAVFPPPTSGFTMAHEADLVASERNPPSRSEPSSRY